MELGAKFANVFPARAGMSRQIKSTALSLARVPRASGDEPGGVVSVAMGCCVPRASGDEPTTKGLSRPWVTCSPRERG